jgi:SPP1 gp7 family putative phage head morphogenesis protein
MVPPRLIELATRHQVFLERLKTGHARDFIGQLRGVETAIVRTLTALDVVTLSEVSRRTLETSLASLEETASGVFEAAIDAFLPKIKKLTEYEVSLETRTLKDVLKGAAKKKVRTPPAAQAYKEVLNRPIQATGEKLEAFVDNWSKRQVAKVNGVIRTGHQQGKTVAEMVKQVRGSKAANFKDGIVTATRREAEAVVHTSIQHAASTARFVTWEENEDLVTGYEWVSTLDSRTTTQCRSLDGKKFKVGKGPTPPIHIRCRSTTAADMDDAFDFLDEGATRSSTDGYVNADLSYYDWLKKQPTSFQDSVLGKTRGKLFRDGGLSAKRFADLQLDRNFEPLTLEEMRSLEPLAFQRADI